MDGAFVECGVYRYIVHLVIVVGFPDDFVTLLYNCISCSRSPNALKLHAVVKDIIAKMYVFLPHGGCTSHTISVVVSIADRNSFMI